MSSEPPAPEPIGEPTPMPPGPPPGTAPSAAGPPAAGQPPGPPPVGALQITGAFGYGWRKLMETPGLWLLVALVALLAGSVTSWLAQVTNNSGGSAVFGLLQFIISNLVGYTLLVMALHAVNGRPVSLPDFRNELNPIATYFAGTILYSVGVFFSLIFLIVPGIMFAVAYYFYGLIIVDTGADPVAALKDARQLSKGKRWPLFGAGVLAFLITILGLIACGIGLLFTIPVNSIAAAHIYKQLRGQPIAA